MLKPLTLKRRYKGETIMIPVTEMRRGRDCRPSKFPAELGGIRLEFALNVGSIGEPQLSGAGLGCAVAKIIRGLCGN